METQTLRDRLDLSLEILSIADALSSAEQQNGRTVEIEQARCRLRELQRVVFAQLRILLDACESDVAGTSGRVH